jgi:hypothetical protein
MKSLAHPYGEDANIVYFEKYALAFTMEQLSPDVMIQYRMLPIKHTGKWNDTMFNVVLHWYERNQGVYVAQTDWTTANTIPLFNAKCS